MEVFIRIGLSIYLLVAALFGVSDYNLLRWVVFLGIAILILLTLMFEKVDTPTKTIFIILFIVICLLFNPIAPIYLYDRGLWTLIDFLSAIVLFVKPIVIMTVDKPFDNIKSDRFDKYKS